MRGERKNPASVTIVGTLPPVTAISPFCIGFVRQVAADREVIFQTIKSPYPKFLYPGTLKDPSSLVLLKALPKKTVIKDGLVWWNLLSWLKTALRTKSETIYLNWWTIALFPMLFTISLICRLRSKKVVAIIHNPVGHERYPGDKLLSKLFFKTCCHYLVFNENARATLNQRLGVNVDSIEVIDHPPLNFYPNHHISKNEARKKLGLPLGATIYLSFGRIRGYKNLETIIQNFAPIAKKNSHAHLLIAGEPWISFAPFHKLLHHLKIQKRTRLFLEFIPTTKVAFFFRAADYLLLAHQDPASGSGIKSLAANHQLPVIDLLKNHH